uniref:Uncharacterized protein n=1 Tax=Triticum urartu TaxID=4572 RepID=A0A8R7UZ38_TRIUA
MCRHHARSPLAYSDAVAPEMAPPPPPCRRCKSRCASSLATGTLFGIYFESSFLHAAIIPWNVRSEFNNLTGDSVTFETPGEPTMEIEKGRKMTRVGGDGWVH